MALIILSGFRNFEWHDECRQSVGSSGDDIISGAGGVDAINAGAGDDIISVTDITSFS